MMSRKARQSGVASTMKAAGETRSGEERAEEEEDEDGDVGG